MENLDKVKDNLVTMRRHFAFLGIKDVTEVTDSLEDMVQAFKKLVIKCTEANLAGSKTKLLVYVYASTHGVMYAGSTKT